MIKNNLINSSAISIIILIILLNIKSNNCINESTLRVVFCPKSIELRTESQPIKSSSIADFISLTLGYTLVKPFEWKGIESITNVLELPKASFTLRIDGNFIHSHYSFPILETENIDNVFDIVSKRTENRFTDNKPFLLRIDSIKEDLELKNELLLNYLSITFEKRFSQSLNDIKIKQFVSNANLDPNDPNIKLFITEIGTLKQLVTALKKVKDSNNNLWPIRGVFWVEIRGLKQIIDSSKFDTTVKSEVLRFFSDFIKEMTNDLRTIYNDKVIFTSIEEEMSHILVRKTRSLSPENKIESNNTDLNLAHDYDPNFHTAFAMLAFTTILIAIIVFGVSVAMWNIDPGRDSIIYRMTAQRIKKEQ